MWEGRENVKETIKERVIDSMFDRWCGQTDYDADARAAMEKAVKERYRFRFQKSKNDQETFRKENVLCKSQSIQSSG